MADNRAVTIPIEDLERIEKRAAKAGELAKTGAEFGLKVFGKYGTVITALLAGAAGWFLFANKAWSDNIPYVKDNWWAKPAGLLALGWVLYWKKSKLAQAVLFLAAALFVQGYRNKKLADERTKWAADPKNAAAVAAMKAAGAYPADETGAPYEFEAAGAWGKDAAGNDRFVPGDRPAAFADRVFENARAS